MSTSSLNSQGIDHNSAAFIADPYPLYETLHDSDPVHQSSHYGGYFLVTRYEDVRNVLLDWGTYSSGKPGVTSIPPSVTRDYPEIPLEVDPPEHRVYRALVTPWFSRRRVESLEGDVRAITVELLNRLVDRESVDFVQDLAAPLVSRALAVFLHVPDEESYPWVGWMSDIFHGRLRNRELADVASANLVQYVDSKIAAAQKNPGDDFFGMLVQLEFEGRRLTDRELRGYGILTMTAGQETTVNGIGNMLWHLGMHKADRDRLRSDPALIPTAVEELLRYLSPIQLLGRTAASDTELCGVVIPEGSTVAVCYGAANRDKHVFDSPNEFVLDRANNPHIAFGAGPHACLGAHLARLEMKVVAEEVLARTPDYEVEAGGIEMTPHGDLRGPWRLPVVLSR